MSVFAYIRVSTTHHDQTTDNQKKLIQDEGFQIDEWFSEDGVSGSIPAMERPAFKAMLSKVKEGDIIVCTMVDRLGRTAADILHTVEHFRTMKVKVRIMQLDGIDVTSSMGKLVLTVLSACAELEKNLIIERTNAGLARAKASGKVLGKFYSIPYDKFIAAKKEYEEDGATVYSLAKKYKVAYSTLYKYLEEFNTQELIDEYKERWNKQMKQKQQKRRMI